MTGMEPHCFPLLIQSEPWNLWPRKLAKLVLPRYGMATFSCRKLNNGRFVIVVFMSEWTNY